MSTKDLRAKYGGNSRQALARAIRAEIPNGEAIMAREGNTYRRVCAAQRLDDGLVHTWNDVHVARVAAENEIRRRYGMRPRLDGSNLPPVPGSCSDTCRTRGSKQPV